MSETRERYTEQQSAAPRAVIHKNILDAAVKQPDASMQDLADDVTGATVDLVEKVLEEYGDPGEDTATEESATMADIEEVPVKDTNDTVVGTNGQRESFPDTEGELTEKQRETLWAIHEYPEATQSDLADTLGVTAATINTRVNTIEGFDWTRRHEFVDEVLDDEPELKLAMLDRRDRADQRDETKTDDVADGERRALVERVQTLEEQVQNLKPGGKTDAETECSLSDDPELVHKMLHACLHSEQITEEEELAIVKAFVD